MKRITRTYTCDVKKFGDNDDDDYLASQNICVNNILMSTNLIDNGSTMVLERKSKFFDPIETK